jgi:hypothetical protein
VAQSLGVTAPEISAVVVAAVVATKIGGFTPLGFLVTGIGAIGLALVYGRFARFVPSAGGTYAIVRAGEADAEIRTPDPFITSGARRARATEDADGVGGAAPVRRGLDQAPAARCHTSQRTSGRNSPRRSSSSARRGWRDPIHEYEHLFVLCPSLNRHVCRLCAENAD